MLFFSKKEWYSNKNVYIKITLKKYAFELYDLKYCIVQL